MSRFSKQSSGDTGRPYLLAYKEFGDLGYVPDKKPWIRAARPLFCPNCGVEGHYYIARMEPDDDGWDCRRCGWNLFDIGTDYDRQDISNNGRHIRGKPGAKHDN